MCGTQRFFDSAFGMCNYFRFKCLAHKDCCVLAGGRLASVGDSGNRCYCWHHLLAYIQTLAGYRTMVTGRSGL